MIAVVWAFALWALLSLTTGMYVDVDLRGAL